MVNITIFMLSPLFSKVLKPPWPEKRPKTHNYTPIKKKEKEKHGLYHMDTGLQCQENALPKVIIFPMVLALIDPFVI